MPLIEDLLLRFRRVWAPPGPVAGQAGVPEDAAAHLNDELRDLTVALQSIEEEGDEIVRAAQAQATSIAEAARVEAARIVETARAGAPAVRAERAAARVRDRQAEIDRVIADAQTQAAVIRERARERMQPVVSRVVADVLALGSPEEEGRARVVGGR